MASLRDVPKVWRSVGPWTFAKRVYQQMSEDSLFTWASALAYSWLFAIFPFLLFLLTLIPFLPKQYRAGAEHQLAVVVWTYLPKDAAWTVWQNISPRIHEVLDGPPAGIRSVLSIGLIVTLWAASGGMNMTMLALDRCYDVTKFRPYWKQRPLAILLTIVVATLIVAVLVLLPVGSIATNWAIKQGGDLMVRVGLSQKMFTPLLVVWQIARYGVGLGLMLMAIAVTYYFGPNIKQKWRSITPGAVFSIVVWLFLGALFRYYVDRFGKYNQTYGTVGGVAILLLFFYIDAIVLLIGAEINSEIDFATADTRPIETKSSP